ncbi:MAG: hypothetical protein HYY17_06255, partial [Planctomycetes bacterium]|nr:hypothetical protein [Planctomycetota bacterium]
MSVLLAILSLAGTAVAQENKEDTLPGKAESSFGEDLFGVPIHGALSLKYRVRWGGGETDNDLYQHLSTDIGDPDRDKLTGHLFFRASEDLDGNTPFDGFYPFDEITDT